MPENIVYQKPLQTHPTPIPGLHLFDLPVYGDNRGWFKENWQQQKMSQIGLNNFRPVQNNISFNQQIGTTRGLHAEPWDKFVSLATGSVFGVWVDLRAGKNFGTVFTTTLTPDTAIFVPRGVANGFQTLEENTVYTYLVNAHWSAQAQNKYSFVNLADKTLNINWPIPLNQVQLSEKDKNHPQLKHVTPMLGKKTLIFGANGQLGKALQQIYPQAELVDRNIFDISDPASYTNKDWNEYDTLINAAAYTKVDLAEIERVKAWETNVQAVANMVKVANQYDLTLVHISSDYVFAGNKKTAYTEKDSLCPLGVYGQTKAAGDILVATVPKHYIVRTSWVVGEGDNFVKTMTKLAQKKVSPQVVADQFGRLSFTDDIASGIKHLLDKQAAYGVYNLSCDGETQSWADIAKKVYTLVGSLAEEVVGVSTAEYFGQKQVSPRPENSVLCLDKIKATGFYPQNLEIALQNYVKKILATSSVDK